MEMTDITKTEDGSIIKGRRQCILVEGAPGVGKSTFAWKLCQQWSKGKILQQYRLVVLLRLREKKVRETQTASDLFRRCERTAIEEICQNGGEGVVLVLDGWDELPAELRGKDSFFLDLFQGQELPDATVVVTSRPHASELIVTECQNRIFQHIEIMGFSEDNVVAYMRSSAGDDAELLQGLQMYTSCYPHIRSMMYNPLNAAIVVEVYKNSWKEESTIPKTMTELYSSLIRTLLLRYLREHPVHRNRKWTRRLRQFSDLPPDVYQQLCRVSRVAYEGLSNNQQVIFSDLPDDFDSLGLMQCVPELYVDEGAALSYNFLHLTIQEFLAAFHLSQQSTEKQMEILKCHQKTSIYRMVLKFFAGLTNFKGFDAGVLLSILKGECKHEGDIQLDLDGLHCLFEGKQISKVLGNLTLLSFFTGKAYHMSPFDCFVLGYVASHTSCNWSIDASFASIYVYHYLWSMFVKGAMDNGVLCAPLANPIHLTITVIALQGQLVKARSFLSRVTHLRLQGYGLESQLCDLLSQTLPSLPHLQLLDLSNKAIGSTPLSPSEQTSLLYFTTPATPYPPYPSVQLIKALCDHNTLKSLDLYATRIGLPECAALAKWLSSSTCSLEVLRIGRNNLTSEATKQIITNLCQKSTVQKLDISYSEINNQLLIALFRLPFVLLDLSNCHIGPEAACEITAPLSSNTVLEELDLSHNPIGDRGALALADVLLNNKRLNTLVLHSTSLTAQGTQALLQSLQHNATLSLLWLTMIEPLKVNTVDKVNKCELVWTIY